MGELLRQIKTEKLDTGGRRELMQAIMDSMSEGDAADLLAALQDPQVPAVSITTVLNRNGHQISYSAVAAWRRRRGIR